MKGLTFLLWFNMTLTLATIMYIAVSMPSPTKGRVFLVDPDPRYYSECSPVLSCMLIKDAPLGKLSHHGISVQMKTPHGDGDASVTIHYGEPFKPCQPKDDPFKWRYESWLPVPLEWKEFDNMTKDLV